MRRQVLLRSVAKLCREDERAHDAAYMWQRHRLMVPYALASFLALMAVATASGFQTWFARVGLGVAGAALAAAATTEYRVIARTSREVVLFKASRIRMAAIATMERLGDSPDIDRAGTTMLANDWTVNGRRYTVAKSSESAMQNIAGRL